MKNVSYCPKCNSENIYFDGSIWTCPECFYEWNQQDEAVNKTVNSAVNRSEESIEEPQGVSDAYGNALQNGDTVTIVKDLKVKGSSSVVKVGTKVKNIRLMDAGDGHDISCKIDGFGAMNLKSEYVKKV